MVCNNLNNLLRFNDALVIVSETIYLCVCEFKYFKG